MSIRDLVFSPLYPYRYKTDNGFIFSKKPILYPSMIERAKYNKIIEEINKKKGKYNDSKRNV